MTQGPCDGWNGDIRNPPCRDCPDRTAECHADCERYLAYRAECDRMRRERIESSKGLPDYERIAKAIRRKVMWQKAHGGRNRR